MTKGLGSCGGENSRNVWVFGGNRTSGELSPLGKILTLPSPKPILHRFRSLMTFLLVGVALVSPANPQCVPSWASGFESSGTNGIVYASIVHDDGGGPCLFVGGSFTHAGATAASSVAKWNGTHWQSVAGASGQGVTGYVFAFAEYDDGTGPALYAGGQFFSAGGIPASNVAKWNGTSWSPLSTGLDGAVRAMTTFDDGSGSGPRLVVTGDFVHAGALAVQRIASWNGSAWSPLGAGLAWTGTALCVHDDGNGPALYAAGSFAAPGGGSMFGVGRWNGSAWTVLGAAASSDVNALCSFDDGAGAKLYAAGRFSSFGGAPALAIGAWDGTNWIQVGAGFQGPPWVGHPGQYVNAEVNAMAVFDDGNGPKLYATGIVGHSGSVALSGIARLDAGGFTSLGVGLSGAFPVGNCMTPFVGTHGPLLFVGGTMSGADGVGAEHLVAWDGQHWSGTSSGLGAGGHVQAFARFDEGSANGPALFAGGSFTSIGGVEAHYVARWDGTSWSAVGTPGNEGVSGPVYTMLVHDDGSGPALYVGGSFSTAAGTIGVRSVARWDGSQWSSVGPSTFGFLSAMSMCTFDSGTGPKLCVGTGTYPDAGLGGVRVWDGSSWSQVGAANFNGSVEALASFDDGGGRKLYAGGAFISPGWHVARWDGVTWDAFSCCFQRDILTFAVYDEGAGPRLFAGGTFDYAPGSFSRSIVRWDGSTWTPVGGLFAGGISELATFDDGSGNKLYAGGSFVSIASMPASGMAAWNGSTWTALGVGVHGYEHDVRALIGHDDAGAGGPALFVGGSFDTAGSSAASHVSRWDGCGVAADRFCFGDGSGTSCPCGNDSPIGTYAGCVNGVGTAGRLDASGEASVAHDTLVLHTSALPQTVVLYAQGTTALASGGGVPYADGLACIGGPVVRLAAITHSIAGSRHPSPTSVRISTAGNCIPGATRRYQVLYRDTSSFCTTATFNTTNAVEVTWKN